MTDQAPKIEKVRERVEPRAAAVAAAVAVAEAPFAGEVTAVSFTPDAAATGATATKRTYTLVNAGAAGAGTTVIATFDGVTGADLVAFDEKAFTLSVVADATDVADGDILKLVEAVTSTGTANPGGVLEIDFDRA